MATEIVDDRPTALKIGYAATDWSMPVEYETYEAFAADWDVKLLARDGEPIGRRGDRIAVAHPAGLGRKIAE